MRIRTLLSAIVLTGAVAFAQLKTRAPIPPTDPAIQYGGEVHDAVAELNRKLQSGAVTLTRDRAFGYLPSVLDALGVPVESQVLVFSKTSLQSMLISPGNPRAIYFNDSVAVAWVRGGSILELIAQDPQQGAIFYSLDQSPQTRPLLLRDSATCTGCHHTDSSLGVPGMIVRTVFPKDTGAIVTGLIGAEATHRTPFEERWGGWYVTGKAGPPFHRANAIVSSVREGEPAAAPERREPLQEKFSTTGYPTPYSDVVALTLFEHQAHMMNQITRIGWDARRSPRGIPGERETEEFVDYLLFIDEAPLTGKVEGTSGFAPKFETLGPFDSKKRSLRQFDLQTRLMRYPCSYMIYSDAFKALPAPAKDAIYSRMWAVLSGSAEDKKYARLSAADRRAVVEILRETLTDLPEYFTGRE